jgi:hypothetical protein
VAFSAKTNQIVGPAATGDAATTDPGFQPSALFMWGGAQAATGGASNAEFSLGVAASSTSDMSAGYNSLDVATTSDTVRVTNTAAIMDLRDVGATTNRQVATLTSLDATGFTPNFTTLDVVNPLYNYLTLGGSDITNVYSGNYMLNVTTGNQSITDPGFQPDVVFMFATLQSTSGAANNATQFSFGVMDAAGNQWATCQKAQHNVGTSNTNRGFLNNGCLLFTQTGADGTAHAQSFVSMDANGFTVNITTALGTGAIVNYIAIKGGQWKVGTETQKTSTGTKATTGIGFTPSGGIFATVCDTQTAGNATNARLCIGASTGASNNVSTWTGDADNSALMVTNTYMSNNRCLLMATEGLLATPTIQAEAKIDSFSSDTFTMDYITADATARVFGYAVFGANPVGGGATYPGYVGSGGWF